jgi:hypothetical protein
MLYECLCVKIVKPDTVTPASKGTSFLPVENVSPAASKPEKRG